MTEFDESLDGAAGPTAESSAQPGPKPRTSGGGGGVMLAAAMLALGDILEPDKAGVEIAEQADDDSGPDFDLDFGDLPPLD